MSRNNKSTARVRVPLDVKFARLPRSSAAHLVVFTEGERGAQSLCSSVWSTEWEQGSGPDHHVCEYCVGAAVTLYSPVIRASQEQA